MRWMEFPEEPEPNSTCLCKIHRIWFDKQNEVFRDGYKVLIWKPIWATDDEDMPWFDPDDYSFRPWHNVDEWIPVRKIEEAICAGEN